MRLRQIALPIHSVTEVYISGAASIDVLIILEQTNSLKIDLIVIGIWVYARVNCSLLGGHNLHSLVCKIALCGYYTKSEIKKC